MTNFLKKNLYDKTGAFKLALLTSPLFIAGLVAKMAASFFFASDYFGKLFIPFLKYHVLSGFQDPYAYFYSIGMTSVFPYPKMMLYIMSLPGILFKYFLNADIFAVTYFELFIYRLPIIFADIVILVILSRWLKGKEKQLILFYWLSPILFYINYLHGQLDAIPIMLVFVFLYFLFKEKWDLSYIFLGLAIATKFHIIILVPFTVVYIWRKRKSIREIAIFTLILALVFFVINNADLLSPGFQELVFNNKEQFKVFDLYVRLGWNIIIYLIPLAYIVVFFHSLTFRFFNRDVFVMFLGFSFGILTLLIPPMPGWYYWVMPFFVYFYVKNASFSKLNLWMLTAGYFLYFLVMPQSDFFRIFQYVSTDIALLPPFHIIMRDHGLRPEHITNLALTFLQAVLLVNVIWLYRRGVEDGKKSTLYNMPYLIGIAGDSGSGKSTFAELLAHIFGKRNVAIVAGDDMHKWERGHEMWQKYTHLHPGANELHYDLEQALTLKKGDDVYRRHYDHGSGTFTFPNKLESKKVVIFEGLHSFFLPEMRTALDLKVFIMPEEDLRIHWKLLRDVKERGYTKEKVLESIKKREHDSNEFVKKQEEHADITISLRNKGDLTWKLGTDVPLDILLELKCRNGVNMDNLIHELSSFVTIDHFFNNESQLIRVHGNIKETDIEMISYRLVPELYDIVVKEPRWSDDYNGVIELFVCYYMLNTLKLSNHAR